MSGAPPVRPTDAPPFVVRRRRGGRRLYAVGSVVGVAVVLVTVGALTHGFGLATGGCANPPTVDGGGASFLNAIMSSWRSSFTGSTCAQVVYTASSAGQGISSLADRLVDFAATDEPLNASLLSSMPGTTLTLPVTGGPVAIVYSLPGYDHVLNLSPSQLAGIYLGTIANWDSPSLSNNPGLPNEPIVTVHRTDQAGTTYVLTSLLSIYNQTWNASVGATILPTPWPTTPHEDGEKGNSALALEVAATPYSIGYVDLPDAINNHLATAGLLNRDAVYVQPTVATTEAAIENLSGQPLPPASGNWSAVSWVNAPGSSSYPLATLSYFLVLQETSLGHTSSLRDAEALVAWLRFVLTTGQTESGPVDYVNPPAELVAQDLRAVATMLYDGTPIPGSA
jgi:phosphate transport system substrate-binding protein